ncbi:MAG: 23S rRNA (uracil(1939)-C(5))-methyltransferase RlmD, partial [Anaerovoracaceae bacterium]
MIEKGKKEQIKIIDISDQGQGIGKAQGMAIFVPNVVLGDVVTVEFTKVKKNYSFAKLISIDEPSEYRIEALCKHAGDCGGCPLATTSYEGQLLLKEKHVVDRLTRLAGLENPKVNEIIGMDEPFYYRNKATFPISTGGNIMRKGGIIESLKEPSIGFFRGKSHDVVNCEECLIQNPAALAAARATRQFMIEDNITAWDEKWEQGLMRHMVVKTAFESKEVMVTYIINGKGIPNGEKLIGMLDDELFDVGYELASVNVNTNKEKNSKEIYGKETTPYAGNHIIHEQIGQLKYEVSPLSFYQVNPVMTEKLYEKAFEYAGLTGSEYVLDLYCGVGSIGLYLAKNAKYVVGIESVKQAVLDANRNAVINGIVNARFLCGKAEEALPKLLAGEGDAELIKVAKNADVVVLDPPRAGCASWLLDAVVEVNPGKIVYVSCDPATLARDVKYLGEHGYEFVEATPVDMFAWTG